jgi:hypothetical protein
MVVHMPKHPTHCLYSFTAFEGELFGMHLTQSEGSILTEVIEIPITDTEAIEMWKLIWKLEGKKLKYNYYDSHVLMPTNPPKSNTFIPDTDSTEITEAYCSQILVIILRESIESSKLRDELQDLNSRLTSPNSLWKTLNQNIGKETQETSAQIVNQLAIQGAVHLRNT